MKQTIHLLVGDKAKCNPATYSRFSYIRTTSDPAQVNCKRCLNTVKRVVAPALGQDYVGKVLIHTFGYDMTINEYALVIKQNAKSVVCREVMPSVSNDYGKGEGKSVASRTFTSDKPFIAVPRSSSWRGDNDKVYFAGRGAAWYIDDGKPSYYNTWD